MTNPLFNALDVYHDNCSRSAAMNMAIDEALLDHVTTPSIRFYRWQSPALSFGYFGRFSHVAAYVLERDLVRRWTGGGIVFHGEDLTYALVIPADDPAFNESSLGIYERVHQALRRTLDASGATTELLSVAVFSERRSNIGPTVRDRRYSRTAVHDAGYSCFANPVAADVMLGGRKIAGAAQRRTRRGLLQQGSIQNVEIESRLVEGFAERLCASHSNHDITEKVLLRARELAQQKYSTDSWLRKR